MRRLLITNSSDTVLTARAFLVGWRSGIDVYFLYLIYASYVLTGKVRELRRSGGMSVRGLRMVATDLPLRRICLVVDLTVVTAEAFAS